MYLWKSKVLRIKWAGFLYSKSPKYSRHMESRQMYLRKLDVSYRTNVLAIMIASATTSTRLIIANENQLKHRRYVAIAKGMEWLQRLTAERKTYALISYRQMSIKARDFTTLDRSRIYFFAILHAPLSNYIKTYDTK